MLPGCRQPVLAARDRGRSRRRAARPRRSEPAAPGRSRRDRQGPDAPLGAAELPRAAGIADFLLEAGGDLVARGCDPDGDPWHVGIEDPGGGDDLAVIALVRLRRSRPRRSGSISWIVDGRTVHHLIDPRTREPADTGLLAVTVALADPAWAEVWSKVLFVGGRDGDRDRGPVARPGRMVGDRRRGVSR